MSGMSRDYSGQVELFRQNRNICAFLNVTATTKSDVDNLGDKFNALADAGLNLTSTGWLEVIFPTVVRQIFAAKCAYFLYVQRMTSDDYITLQNNMSANGFVSPIWPWVVLPASLSLLAILLNISLIIVTVRKISLSKLCNWLIAFDSLCQIPALLPFMVNLFGVLFHVETIDYSVCMIALMLSTWGCYSSFLALFLMSLERLLIVLFPIKMIKIPESTIKVCSLLAFGICTIFGIVMTLNVFGVWTIVNLLYERWLYCNSGLYSDVLNTPISYILISLALVNYLAIFVTIAWRQRNTKKVEIQQFLANAKSDMPILSDTTRRMLRSVCIISIILLIGWVLGSAARNVITTFTINAVNTVVPALFSDSAALKNNVSGWLIGVITCLMIIASGIGAPVLIMTNSKYRKAYRSTFLGIFGRSTSVGPLFTANQQ